MADSFIEEELSDEFVPVEIELETLDSNGIYSWGRGTVEAWDN